MTARYVCGDPERRALVRASERPLDGIDFVEVIDSEAEGVVGVPRQQLLAVRFLKAVPAALTAEHVSISGGVRITGIGVLWAFPLADFTDDDPATVSPEERAFLSTWRTDDDERDRFWIVRTNGTGDYSPYVLRLDEPSADPGDPALDPRLSSVELYFKVECVADLDCKTDRPCPEPELTEPSLSYLAKDYASFRRLMLDRLAAVTPEWTERNLSDLGVTLVELLAHVGDRLSYAQDAAATEAYLSTARQRISVRRHARLVDYPLREGNNARTWVHFEVSAPFELPLGTRLSTRFEAAEGITNQPPEALALAEAEGAVIFETLAKVPLEPALGTLQFYTWGDQECCLPVGATEATLLWREDPDDPESDPLPTPLVDRLRGAFLAFREVLGPRTGSDADADPSHRHVVRVIRADRRTDPLDDTPVVEIAWHAADALPFPLCISARSDRDERLDRVSVAQGNLVPADHGRTVVDEALPVVPDPVIEEMDLESDRPYRPVLAQAPLTWSVPLPNGFVVDETDGLAPEERPPASSFFEIDARNARAAVSLRPADAEVDDELRTWSPRRDLLSSSRFDRHFVAEVDNRGRAVLRFGDGVHGRRPAPGLEPVARYRTGNGPAGHLGADALRHVFDAPGVVRVYNLLPTWGGEAPEALEEARRYAPESFRVQERAVTADDYARAAERHPEVARAAATLRWTGSWTTVFVTVDRVGGLPVDEDFERRLRDHLERFRRAGHDLEVDTPRFVPLELDLFVCVETGFFASDVRRALLEAFGRDDLMDGSRGFFHPDLWTFGQPLYLSRLLATAAAVPGVASAEVRHGGFRRRGRDEVPKERNDGVLPMGRLEIARLDNDPNFPEHGVLNLELGGGR